jgi:hypothetical protein
MNRLSVLLVGLVLGMTLRVWIEDAQQQSFSESASSYDFAGAERSAQRAFLHRDLAARVLPAAILGFVFLGLAAGAWGRQSLSPPPQHPSFPGYL